MPGGRWQAGGRQVDARAKGAQNQCSCFSAKGRDSALMRVWSKQKMDSGAGFILHFSLLALALDFFCRPPFKCRRPSGGDGEVEATTNTTN